MAKQMKATILDIDKIITDAVKNEVSATRDDLRKIINEAAELGRDKLESTSPVGKKIKGKPRRKPYKSGWVDEKYLTGRRIRNKNKPHLVHLVNDGTKVRTTKEKGSRGRMKGNDHVDNASDTIVSFVESKITKL